jgi:capsular exopolysaccharide synthesis family protein
MGRVDEALRRAAEATRDTDIPSGSPSLPRGADDIETLAREAFPIEIDEHRKPLRQVLAPATTAAPAPVQTPIAPPPSGRDMTSAREATPRLAHPEPPADATPKATPREPAPAAIAPKAPGTSSLLFERIDASLVGKIVIDAEINPASREQYRRLAASFHQAQGSHGLKVLMVTSAVMGEGKTLTASNLALTLSESYKKNVLLIDGDLRRPALHTLFRVESSPGLSEGLTAGDDQRLAVRQISPRLGVLTAGRPSADPIASLTSSRMQRVIEEAREAFDWVIIDTPPVALLPDANLLAGMADGVLLVVRAGSTPYDLAQRAVQAIGRERVLGVVLNSSTLDSSTSSYGYYDYYTADVPPEVPPAP